MDRLTAPLGLSATLGLGTVFLEIGRCATRIIGHGWFLARLDYIKSFLTFK